MVVIVDTERNVASGDVEDSGAASKCNAGMAKAEPIKVWGRVKRHNTIQNGTDSVDVDAVVDVVSVLIELLISMEVVLSPLMIVEGAIGIVIAVPISSFRWTEKATAFVW